MADTGDKLQLKKRGRPRVHPAGSRSPFSRCVVYIGKSMDLWQQLKLDGNFRNDSEFAAYLLQLYQTSRSNKPSNLTADNISKKVSRAKEAATKSRHHASGKDEEQAETSPHRHLGSQIKQDQRSLDGAFILYNDKQDVDLQKIELDTAVDSPIFELCSHSADEGTALENSMITALSKGCKGKDVPIGNNAEQDTPPENGDGMQSLSSDVEENISTAQRSDCFGSGLNLLPKKRHFWNDKTELHEGKLHNQSAAGLEMAEESHVNPQEDQIDTRESEYERECQKTTQDTSSPTEMEETNEEKGEDEHDPEEDLMSDVHLDTIVKLTPLSESMRRKRRSGDQTCSICGSNFPSLYRMGKHMKTVHSISKPFACVLCKNVSFSSKGNLDSHTFHIHTAEKKYTCDMCNASFKLPRHLQRHMIVHSEERPFKCGICNKGFKHREAVKLHERKHSGKKPYLCAQCGAQFVIESSLRSHMVVHTEERPFECTECKAMFKTPATLRMHKEVHTEDSTHLCAVCGEQFKTARALRSHLRRHGEKPHQCSECGNRFAILGELNRHVKVTHSASKPYPCKVCGFRFKLKNYLSTHMARMHSGNRRPHTCVVCRATFKMPLDLKHHMRKHSDLRPFPCDLCDWKFKTKTHLKQHMDIIHGRGGRVKCFARRTIRSADSNSNTKNATSPAPHQMKQKPSQDTARYNDTDIGQSTSIINPLTAIHNTVERTQSISIRTSGLHNTTEINQSIQKGDTTLRSTPHTMEESVLTAPPPLTQPMEQLPGADHMTPLSPVFRDTSWSDTLDSSLIQSAADLDLSMTRPRWPPFQPLPYMFQRQTCYSTDQTSTGYVMGSSDLV
ncbi:zinc finger protein 23-like isoform X2 [Branchiostoma floridae]|uniref:Zinc finger protein 865 n=1 Tax=Branchiostoma floridae TaxID=7739 RepID=A0A9J7HUN1_BRAFL|nr:zinc finger protein 23-like isoform X2 [Branchiostoma floridae]XP_035666222.1 zinc finger protein 23-like isoform X2 [Branchiostoma floridae]